MLVVFPHIFSALKKLSFLAIFGLLAACAAQKEITRDDDSEDERPIAELRDDLENSSAEEEKSVAPVAPASPQNAGANANKSKAQSAGKSTSKSDRRQATKAGKRTSADYGEADDELDDEGGDYDEQDGDNIFFQYASWQLSPAAKKELARVAATLKRNKSARVTLSGHTCDRSGPSVNMRLSRKRAEAAAAYLQQAGISAKRISIDAYGQSQPLAPNTSEQNRAKNRRVEISIEE
ncbi:MAG: OmpA family protein [Prevotellaceae bacterium]|jgi:outer membrane protein OmpA-like peptidoglycan-associated protein|nr:OmpA family protein [Prevotellaceae bacterium]